MSENTCKNCAGPVVFKNTFLKYDFCSFKCKFESGKLTNLLIALIVFLFSTIIFIYLPDLSFQRRGTDISLSIFGFGTSGLLLLMSLYGWIMHLKRKKASQKIAEIL